MTDSETFSANSERPGLEWLTAQIAGLMATTRGPQIHGEEYEAAVSMFCRALMDLPKGAVDQAITKWVLTEEWRPAPADLRKLAQSYISRPVLQVVEFREPYGPAPEHRQITAERAAEIYAEMEKAGKGSAIGARMARALEGK